MREMREIAENKPYLKDTLALYEKVVEFKHLTAEVTVAPGSLAYPPEATDVIFRSFQTAFNMPETILDPLKEAMKLGQIDLTRLPLNEIPAFSLPYHQDELSTILFLISKPYFIQLGFGIVRDAFWEHGNCPTCTAAPSLSFIKQDEGRFLYCSYCENRGRWHRIGCPHCHTRDTDNLGIIEAEEEKGFRIDFCNTCKSYIKTIDYSFLDDYSLELLDIMSLPLDILAQNRGYKRHSPNPIGMMQMT